METVRLFYSYSIFGIQTMQTGTLLVFSNPADQSIGVLRNPGFRGFPIRSNEADMLYIDTQPLNPNSEMAHNVVAHELLHLIHWRHDPHEATWVDEGCAGYASFLCGYSVQEHVAAFERTPSVSLITWSGNGSRFTAILRCCFPLDTLCS